MKNNLIKYHISEIDRYIYRVMPVYRLFEIFEDYELALVEPKKWDDPYENMVLEGMIDGALSNNPGAKAILEIFRSNIYGQCWTLNKETDAMWRIYSADKQGVKVRTTARKLLGSILERISDWEKEGIFIGKVDYLPQKTLLSLLENTNDIYGREIAQTLLLKRREFKHEREVRLILTKGGGEIRKLKFDPHEVFDEIIFDPRINEHLYESFKTSIKARGYKKRVKKSLMYQLPKSK